MLIEKDPDVAERLSYDLDLLAVQGNGASASALEEAGIEEAGLFVAATGISELNVMACDYVKEVSGARTIARVHDAEYIEMWDENPGVFGIDHILFPELMTAERISRILQIPEARDVGTFADGAIQMVEFVTRSDGLVDHELMDLDTPEDSLIAAIIREGEIVIPGGETTIRENDRVIVIGSPDGIERFGDRFLTYGGEVDRVAVIGATEISGLLVERLLEKGIEVRVIEEDEEDATRFAEEFPSALVLNNVGTDIDFLRSERLGDMDAVVSATESDEKNLMTSLLGKRLGAGDSVVKVEDPQYVELFETMGVDAAVNPHRVTSDRILMLTRGASLRSVMVLEEGKAEAMELEVAEGSSIAGKQLSIAGLPQGAIVGGVLRNGDVTVPGGDFELRTGDNVVVFAESTVAETVEDLFN